MPGFSTATPADSAVIDRLRAARRLPEQQDFRAWKAQLHRAYRAPRPPPPYEWHLPDQRTLRVVTTPQSGWAASPTCSMTFTERLKPRTAVRRAEIACRAKRSIISPRPSCCSAATGGSGCTIRCSRRCGNCRPTCSTSAPHIEAVIEQCRLFHRGHETWQSLRAAVTAIDSREPILRRLERTDGSIIDCRTVRLPDGATLMTFKDVTDSGQMSNAAPDRAQHCAGRGEQDQDRFRSPRVLRAATAADQRHRIYASSRRPGDRGR